MKACRKLKMRILNFLHNFRDEQANIRLDIVQFIRRSGDVGCCSTGIKVGGDTSSAISFRAEVNHTA